MAPPPSLGSVAVVCSQYVDDVVLMASSLMRVLPGCTLAKYLTSLSRSICSATRVCSSASWCEFAECRKYSARGRESEFLFVASERGTTVYSQKEEEKKRNQILC